MNQSETRIASGDHVC